MKKATVFYITGLLLIAAALSLSLYNNAVSRKAGEASMEVLNDLKLDIPAKVPHNEKEIAPAIDLPEYMLNPDIPMPVLNVDGTDYIGVLSIPALELELPIISEWDYNRLNISPCRFTGSIYRGDMVICAHNYQQHFGRLRDLSYGDAIIFVDADGNTFNYSVAEIEILPSTAIEDMTAGNFPLSLFTCDITNRSNRVTIRAM